MNVDETKLAQALCYGIAQGEMLRISNRVDEGRKLTEADRNIIEARGNGLATTGEYLGGCLTALVAIDNAGYASLTLASLREALIRAKKAYETERPLGGLIEELRVRMLAVLQTLRDTYPDAIKTVIESVAKVGIEVDLDADLGETQKP